VKISLNGLAITFRILSAHCELGSILECKFDYTLSGKSITPPPGFDEAASEAVRLLYNFS